MSSFDLAVAYRICPQVGKTAHNLPFSHNKLELSEACLRSFRNSLGELRVKLWVLLDGCPGEYHEIFRKYFAPEQLVLVPLPGIGNLPTFEQQIDILLKQRDAELVYFAEDDYFYLPGQFGAMTDFLMANNDADFVTPYDHMDCYRLNLHDRPKWLRVAGNHHWRTAASTCLTFLTRRNTLAETQAVFRSYARGNSDASLWLSLTKESVWDPFRLARYAANNHWLAKIMLKAWLYNWNQILFGRRRKLWVPIPGVATHMDANALSPTIDWRNQMQSQPESSRASLTPQSY